MDRGTSRAGETLRVEHIRVARRRYDPHMDGYIVLGAVKYSRSPVRHVVAWQSRHAGTAVDCRFYENPDSARRQFNRAAKKGCEHSLLQKDWQKKKLHDWENRFLMPHSRRINEQDALRMIRRFCRDYSLPVPQLTWKKKEGYSVFDNDTNELIFGHRDNISLLHELAHDLHKSRLREKADDDDDDYDTPMHPPGFVWCAIELYHRYAGLGLDYMVVSAHSHGLLGDMKEDQFLDSKSGVSKAKRSHEKKERRIEATAEIRI